MADPQGRHINPVGPTSDGATEVAIEFAYQPKFGVIGQLLGSIALDGQFTKGIPAFLKDLDTASTH